VAILTYYCPICWTVVCLVANQCWFQQMLPSKPRLGVHLTRVYQCLSECGSIGGVPKPKSMLAPQFAFNPGREAMQKHYQGIIDAGASNISRELKNLELRDILRCGRKWRYSITSSAVASSVCGNVRPSALAVLRLSTRSNFVGCSRLYQLFCRGGGCPANHQPCGVDHEVRLRQLDVMFAAGRKHLWRRRH